MTAEPERRLLLTLAGDIHLKSSRTRRRLMRLLRQNLAAGLADRAPGAKAQDGPSGRMSVLAPDPDGLPRATAVAATTFGVYRVEVARRLSSRSVEALVEEVGALAEPAVTGRRFAVRARVRASDWTRTQLERAIGQRLLRASAGVDLDDPEAMVRVQIWGEDVFLIEERLPGADGLPLGTQPPLLSLLSGGFDSPVAAWMMMRRGSPVDLVHFVMDCAQSDHALALAFELWRTWGAGTSPRAWLVDFGEVKEALVRDVDDAHRQVVLKQLMFVAATALARVEGRAALVTGESVGQVSSQTVQNLVQIDRAHDATVFRPLSGLTKEEIVAWSRRVGTHDLSARAREVCDISSGPVETSARRHRLERAVAGLPPRLVDRALASRRVVAVPAWEPGLEPVPVVDLPPEGVALVMPGQPLPPTGPVALTGDDAVERATAARREGREVWMVSRTPSAAQPCGKPVADVWIPDAPFTMKDDQVPATWS